MKRIAGFTMVEVLVSLLVLMFGIMGIAGLQMMAVGSTEFGRYQGVATILASSMAAKMKGNQSYWATPPPSVTVQNAAITGGPPSFSGTCVGSVCTAAQMAYFDLANWGASLAGSLPVGQGTITCTTTVSPAVCTLQVSWAEKNVALINAKGNETGQLATGQATTHSYQTIVTMM